MRKRYRIDPIFRLGEQSPVTMHVEVDAPDDFPVPHLDLLTLLGTRLVNCREYEWPGCEVAQEVPLDA